MRTVITSFRKRDFEAAIQVDELDPALAIEFADAVCRARPSRLDNHIEIEVSHRDDRPIHYVVQMVVDRGVRRLSVKTKDPISIDNDPRAYMEFDYENGKVVDQWTEMSHREGAEPMVDVITISFEKKTVTDCVREAPTPAPRHS
jgi:hypothetical protein